MTQSKFKMPSLSSEEKEKKEAAFLTPPHEKPEDRKVEKEDTKNFAFRLPSSLYDDLREVSALTGISINSICLEIIRPLVKKKLKDLKEDV